MALDDYFETEVGVAVAATAALFSPRVRKVLRRGAVYGVAGALMAGDAVTAFARGVSRSAQQAAAAASQAAPAPARNAAQPSTDGGQTAAQKGGATAAATKGAGKGTGGTPT
jgi:hypothetical protein